MNEPVTTIYERPIERVLFSEHRDANPFFHLYESLWMLAGRSDVASVVRYAGNMKNYSDDGVTLHGAYGYRWRNAFDEDQLETLAGILRKNKDDRRCILQMWDTMTDLNVQRKDVPCNVMAHFQINRAGALDMTVFCRSNDIVWGAYGANAVHFSVLLEYMAMSVGVPMGRYFQVSDNWHGYHDTLFPLAEKINSDMLMFEAGVHVPTRYSALDAPEIVEMHGPVGLFDQELQTILHLLDNPVLGIGGGAGQHYRFKLPFFNMAWRVLKAHEVYRETPDAPDKYVLAARLLTGNSDWEIAGREWLQRRYEAWKRKLEGAVDGGHQK